MSIASNAWRFAGPRYLIWALLATLTAGPAPAATWDVSAGARPLQDVLEQVAPGDVLHLKAGVHSGPITIAKPVTIEGESGALIKGNGTGSVITLDAPDVTLRGLAVSGSGNLLETEDSAIFVTERGDRAVVTDNQIEGNLIGVYLKGPDQARVIANRIKGRDDLRLNERGNGVQIWRSPGSIVEGNAIRAGRDGIFVTTSKNNIFRGNRFENVRFAVHYMYTNDSEVSFNISAGNHLGYAIMYSSRIRVIGNRSLGDRDHGILLNAANSSVLEDNLVLAGPKKCVFIYNANKNRFAGNWFEGCGIGIHFTAGSERNSFSGNAFVSNQWQVKYVGSRHIEWSHQGRGNYWSDNTAFDLNGDGIADRPYKPNDIVDHLVWRYPAARLLLGSPVLHLIRWAQSAFPAIYPGGVTDSAALMAPPQRPGEAG